jgi:hypothetical protein
MSVCAAAIVTQAVLMTLNFALGYYKKDNTTVGPGYFYYLFISILPVVMLTVSQLYLTHNSKLMSGMNDNSRRHADALLFDYDSETSMMDSTVVDQASRHVYTWRSDSPWNQDSASSASRKTSVKSSIISALSGTQGATSTNSTRPTRETISTSTSSKRVIKSIKTYRDPLLDYKYTDVATSNNDNPSSLPGQFSQQQRHSLGNSYCGHTSPPVQASARVANSTDRVGSGHVHADFPNFRETQIFLGGKALIL